MFFALINKKFSLLLNLLDSDVQAWAAPADVKGNQKLKLQINCKVMRPCVQNSRIIENHIWASGKHAQGFKMTMME